MGSLVDGVWVPDGVSSATKATSELPRWEEEELGQTAYQRLVGEMLDIPQSKVTVVNLNLTEAIATALGVLPNVRAHREGLSKSLLDCRFDWVDGLEDYTLALNFARAEYLTVTRPQRCAPEVWLEARQVRRVLVQDWRALAARGLADESLLSGVQRGKGYLELGTDLTVLTHVHRAYAASSGAALSAEAERAPVLAQLILAAGEPTDPKSEAVLKAREMQNRAFTVFVRSYNEVRSSIAYLRRAEGDIDRIIPSLYAARRGRVSEARRTKRTKDIPANSAPRVAAFAPPLREATPANSDATPVSSDSERSADTQRSASSVPPFEEKEPPSSRKVKRTGFVN